MSISEADNKPSRYVGTVSGTHGRLGTKSGEPFYEIELPVHEQAKLAELLKGADREARSWVKLAATYDDANRLRVLYDAAPAYEVYACPDYFRGDIMRVNGRRG